LSIVPEDNRVKKATRELTAIAVAENGTLIAVGDQEGMVRCFEMTPERRVHSNPVFALLPVKAGGGVVNSTTRCLSWAASNGRSYFSLVMATSSELCVIMFANALHYLLEGTTGVSPSTSNAAAQAPLGLKRLGFRRMEMLESDILKVAWNPLGTRLTTSHTDGTVRVFSVTVTYREAKLRGTDPSQSSAVQGDALIVDLMEVSRAVAPFSTEANRVRGS
jgi:WD40 repeat protein